MFNSAARDLFNIEQGQIVSLEDINTMLPRGFLAQVSEGTGHVYLPETQLKKSNGEKFFARLIGNKLLNRAKSIGMAFSVHDISKVKKLEKEKIEAERMAIVGQTVAGLAHGIKNLWAWPMATYYCSLFSIGQPSPLNLKSLGLAVFL